MNKMFLVGGIAGALAVGYAAKFAYTMLLGNSQSISKETVIKKLIEMRELLYPFLFEIADIVEKRLIPKGVPPDQAKIFIMQNESLAFKSNIETLLQQKVYFDVEEGTLEEAIEKTYKEDKEVQFYKKAFQEEYDRCFLGIKPENLSTKMLLISKDQLLQIVATLLRAKISRLKSIVERVQSQVGKSSQQILADKRTQLLSQGLSAGLAQDQKEDDALRMKLLQESKITDPKTFEFAIAKFLQESTEFKQKYISLQEYFKKSAQELIAPLQ